MAGGAGGGGGCGTPGDHQSRHGPRAPPGPAPRQDRGDQSKCNPQHRRELALRSRATRFSARRRALTAMLSTSASVTNTQGTGPRGFAGPFRGTFTGTGTAAPTANSTLFGVFNAGHFSLFIDALRSNALAKILAEPNLVALDGQPARFLVGGLFPFPVPQSSSIPGGTAVVTVQFQRFGTILTFLPEILPNDVIRLDVEPVISQLNFAQGTTVNGGMVPSITERSARTVVELQGGADARNRRTDPVGHERQHSPCPGAGRSADRRPLVQRELARNDRDRDDCARDSRAGRPPRQEGSDRSAR